MKKLVVVSFFAGLMLIGFSAFAQNTSEKFLASTSHPVIIYAEKGGIQALRTEGNLGNTPALSFTFQNTTHSTISFSWVVRNATNDVIYTSPVVSLEGGKNLSEDNKPSNSNLTLSYGISSGMLAQNYKLELTTK